MSSISLLGAADLDAFAEHLVRQASQSGRDGLPVFSPFGAEHRWDVDRIRTHRREAWSRAIGSKDWERAFGVRDGGRLVGHVEVRGGSLATDSHRVWLAMGVEREHHRRGLGRALLEACVDWCRAECSIAWIDLGVFVHNRAARALYRRLGFAEVGTTRDRFRVDGLSIDDVHLVLRVESE